MYSILYVDDDPHLLEITRFFLEEKKQLQVTTALLATEALRRPDLGSFDAIVSDYEMPKMDGIAFLKKVREAHGDIPFIIYTGKGREQIVIEAINNGADSYLQKGGDPTSQFAELAHKIQNAVERRRAKQALEESERRYRNLYEYALVGLFETSLKDATIIACNQKYCDMAGFPSIAEAIGSDVLQIYASPRDREEVSRILHEQGSLQDHIVQFRNIRTGTTFWAQFSARLNKEKDRAEGTIIDVTEQKTIEEQLRNSEERFRSLVENLQDPVLIIGFDAAILYANRAALALVGFLALPEGQPLYIGPFLSPESRERALADLEEIRVHGGPRTAEYCLHTADGGTKWVEALGVRVPWKGSDQDLVALRDITWRRNAEEDLRFKNALLTAQQETSPNAILIVDEKGRILNYNQRFIDLWKIRPGVIAAGIDEPVLQSVLEQIADPDAFLARVRYLYTHPEERSFEEISLRDGRVLERFSSPVLGSDGRHYGRVWYFREIKEHR